MRSVFNITHWLRRFALYGIIAGAFSALAPMDGAAQQALTGKSGLELRGFAKAPAFEDQARHSASVFFQPEFFVDWAEGSHRIVVSPFVRLDANDSNRSHFDIREAYWQWYGRSLEIRVGFARVFWGVTETRHLVDIINQTDGIEGPDGEVKLGQPMFQATWITDFGTFEAFVMPFFRERTFPGSDGRLRPLIPVGVDHRIRHERIDLAVRYSRYFGSIDFGISGFWGTSREPILAFDPAEADLNAEYPTIGQVGLDGQWTSGSWLTKLEAIYRSGYGSDFAALVSGIEYTFANVNDSGIDVGLLAEFHLDGRSDILLAGQPFQTTPFDDDIFGGVRLALNDVQSTSVLAGAVVDRGSGETAVFIEASRRLGSRMTADIEIRSFNHTDTASPLYFFRDDAYAQLQISYFF